jgi:hypothetical protein
MGDYMKNNIENDLGLLEKKYKKLIRSDSKNITDKLFLSKNDTIKMLEERIVQMEEQHVKQNIEYNEKIDLLKRKHRNDLARLHYEYSKKCNLQNHSSEQTSKNKIWNGNTVSEGNLMANETTSSKYFLFENPTDKKQHEKRDDKREKINDDLLAELFPKKKETIDLSEYKIHTVSESSNVDPRMSTKNSESNEMKSIKPYIFESVLDEDDNESCANNFTSQTSSDPGVH